MPTANTRRIAVKAVGCEIEIRRPLRRFLRAGIPADFCTAEIVVPGKILGSGRINHSLTVASFGISEKAKVKLEAVNAKYISIPELLEKNPKGSNVRIIR